MHRDPPGGGNPRALLEDEMRSAILAVTVAVTFVPAFSAVLKPETAKAWQQYVQAADGRTQTQPDAGKPFMWVDQSAERRARAQRGEVVVEPVAGRGLQEAPDGLIHDWIGAIFIPNATAESVLAVLDDYDRYCEIYKPVVTDSRA